MGDHRQIGAPAGRRQIAGRRAMAVPGTDGALIIGDAFLAGAVVIGIDRHPHGRRAGDERLAKRMAFMNIRDMLWAADAVKIVRPIGAVLGAPKIRQHIAIGPARIAALRPGVEIMGLATHVEMAIDGTGTAEQFAARKGDRPAVHTVAGGGFKAPGEAWMVDRLDKPGRHSHEGVAVVATGLQQKHRDFRVRRQPIGQHAPRRAGTDNHHVIGVG